MIFFYWNGRRIHVIFQLFALYFAHIHQPLRRIGIHSHINGRLCVLQKKPLFVQQYITFGYFKFINELFGNDPRSRTVHDEGISMNRRLIYTCLHVHLKFKASSLEIVLIMVQQRDHGNVPSAIGFQPTRVQLFYSKPSISATRVSVAPFIPREPEL